MEGKGPICDPSQTVDKALRLAPKTVSSAEGGWCSVPRGFVLVPEGADTGVPPRGPLESLSGVGASGTRAPSRPRPSPPP